MEAGYSPGCTEKSIDGAEVEWSQGWIELRMDGAKNGSDPDGSNSGGL